MITVRDNHNLGLTWADDTAGWCGTPRDTFEHLFETESGEREVTATKLTDSLTRFTEDNSTRFLRRLVCELF